MMMFGLVDSSPVLLVRRRRRRRLALYQDDRRSNIVHDELIGIYFMLGIPQCTAAVKDEHSALERVTRAFQIVRNILGPDAQRAGGEIQPLPPRNGPQSQSAKRTVSRPTSR
jgi:hypothetical protein